MSGAGKGFRRNLICFSEWQQEEDLSGAGYLFRSTFQGG